MEAGRGEEKGKNLSRPFRINGVSRDLLRRQQEEEVELSLGLSLNGRFGVDPSRKKLRRSSSISNLPVNGDGNGGARGAAFEGHAPLVRAISFSFVVFSFYSPGARQPAQARRPPGPVVQKQDIRAGGRDARNGENELLKNALLDMPFVSTKGYGPNHRRIEGFLYRYKMGEAVKIVCVCHGLFLTPAEFVKHGGGGDVENPLKHIVVTPFPIA
ncbi:hypothetical protein BUALT_Bualt16G0022500 [Buddleja alternifolia]|uniref:Ninja-family protein n=1 Tax=Buddleja alternifolia TaxID=168488 RepID=A0AAV6W8L1_9LAMI|nr:hypothetical protein BUALT_Bualt16G0022500 [Buddleja alternifolia]